MSLYLSSCVLSREYALICLSSQTVFLYLKNHLTLTSLPLPGLLFRHFCGNSVPQSNTLIATKCFLFRPWQFYYSSEHIYNVSLHQQLSCSSKCIHDYRFYDVIYEILFFLLASYCYPNCCYFALGNWLFWRMICYHEIRQKYETKVLHSVATVL